MKATSLIIAIVALMVAACSSLRTDHPIAPVADYEMLLVGNLEAGYIGNDNCMAKCHTHDRIRRDFDLSIHGEQLSSETGLPMVNCESCHGAGSLAVENAAEQKRCDTSTFLQLQDFPAQAQSLICLKCHSAASTPVLQFWNASAHASSDVSCSDCHKLHQGPQQKVDRKDMAELCYGCHQNLRSEFAQFSHHPVPEGKMSCTDCHNPHGSATDHLLKGTTVKETCTRCHMDKQGPFVYEHADVTEDCNNCHRPHGSANDPLLTSAEPFLCMQCHAGHQGSSYQTLATPEFKGAYYSRCTDCHSTIHGTDIPSGKGRGTFISR